jgi:hypothetical protein
MRPIATIAKEEERIAREEARSAPTRTTAKDRVARFVDGDTRVVH